MADTGAPYFIPFAEPTDIPRNWPELSEDVALAIVAALENIPVVEKRIEAFTGSGTWTVPAGVTYAIAHMIGGGGGVGRNATQGNGGDSSVAFASGTVTAPGAEASVYTNATINQTRAGRANSGRSAIATRELTTESNFGVSGQGSMALDAQWIVAGAAVTPAASITVTVGAGGSAGTNGAAGGSGYVYIEFFEEV